MVHIELTCSDTIDKSTDAAVNRAGMACESLRRGSAAGLLTLFESDDFIQNSMKVYVGVAVKCLAPS